MNLSNIKDKEEFIEDLYRRLSGLYDDLRSNKRDFYIDRTSMECSKIIGSIINWMNEYGNEESDLNG